MFRPNQKLLTTLTFVLLSLGVLHARALAQEGRPTPQPAPEATVVGVVAPVEDTPPAPELVQPVEVMDLNGRRVGGGDQVILAFDDVSVDDTIPFIVETTGKVVMPVNITTLKAKKITLINDRPIERQQALDLLFQAFRFNDVGIIETNDRVIIAVLSEIPRLTTPVIGPDEDIMSFTNRGAMVTKIFRVENTDAENIAEKLQDSIPDYGSMSVDANSNQIILLADVEFCQRTGVLIEELDRNYVKVKTETFRLAHADASEIAQNILDLFEDTGTPTRSGTSRRAQDTRRMTPEQRRRAQQSTQRTSGATGVVGPTVELRVTVNVQQNSVTVSGEPAVVEEIARLIEEAWDLPRPQTTKKVYHLVYTDPIKMRDMLHELLGEQAGGGIRRTGGRGPGGAAGQRADVSEAIGGIYQIQAYPDSNSLVVICKTEESFEFLGSLILDLDQPVFPGIPIVVELKHADAEQVADQVNAIFAPAGARVDIQRRDTGLTGGADLEGPAGGGDAGGAAREGEQGGTITFPWQQGRPAEDETPASPLIGKVRVVPIHRQNAVMILAAPEYRDAVRAIITDDLDKPGRQVMISAVIAEVELTDELALGIRFSNSNTILGGTPVDNRIGGTSSFSGSIDDVFGGIFDTSVLDVNASLNVVLQALSQKTKVRVLQEPAVFTADNQEASFFEGQDVPVLQTTQTTAEGTVNETTEYFSVGINLNVRPRITAHGDVDIEINLELSNIDVAASAVAVSPVFDRRETTTQIIVQDGQTIVISGILRDFESRVRRKVPLLGDIPLVGEIFKSWENQTTRTELLAFITPYVVDNVLENDTNYNERARKRLEQLSKPLKEQEREEPEEQIRKRLLQPGIDKGRISPDALDEINEG
jgi:general secretion pathway protein D